MTAADMAAGHVRLDIPCLDRLYLNGYVAKLQIPAEVIWFFHEHRGKRSPPWRSGSLVAGFRSLAGESVNGMAC